MQPPACTSTSRSSLRPLARPPADTPTLLQAGAPTRADAHFLLPAAVIILFALLAWAIARSVFYVGIIGSDDLYYLRFAARWHRAPNNHWEARLLGNALIALSMKLFGTSVSSAVLPSLVASAATLVSAAVIACRLGGWRAGAVAALIVALCPVDVDLATSVSPFTVMVGLLSVGTAAFLLAPESPAGRVAAAMCFALGVTTHFAGVYYVATLTIVATLFDRRRFLGLLVLTVMAGILTIAAECLVYHVLYGDPFLRLKICRQSNRLRLPILPRTPDGAINWDFFIMPVRQLLYSRAYGPMLLLCLAMGFRRFRTRCVESRVVLVTLVVFWLWMSFGSKVPWRYVPFWRMERFQYPAVTLLAVAMAVMLAERRSTHPQPASGRFTRPRPFVLMAIVGVCLLANLFASGSGGQNVVVSRQLGRFAADHPQEQFVTDYHTLNEIWATRGLSTPANIATLVNAQASQLLDPNAKRITHRDAENAGAILINPLNANRTSHFDAFVARHAGRVIWTTEPQDRTICLVFPFLKQYDWCLRRPGAIVSKVRPTTPAPRLAPQP